MEPPAGGTGGTADEAAARGQQVAGDAQRHASEVAGTAREEAGRVVDQARDHARDLAHDARSQLHDQARQQTEQLGGAIGQFGARIHALADGRPEEAGPVGAYADRIADQVDHVASRVEELGFDGVVHEAERYARRRPGLFLLGAAVAGFAVSRLARGAQQAQQEGMEPVATSDRIAGDGAGGSPSAGGPPAVPSGVGTVPAGEPPAVPPAPLRGAGEDGR